MTHIRSYVYVNLRDSNKLGSVSFFQCLAVSWAGFSQGKIIQTAFEHDVSFWHRPKDEPAQDFSFQTGDVCAQATIRYAEIMSAFF